MVQRHKTSQILVLTFQMPWVRRSRARRGGWRGNTGGGRGRYYTRTTRPFSTSRGVSRIRLASRYITRNLGAAQRRYATMAGGHRKPLLAMKKRVPSKIANTGRGSLMRLSSGPKRFMDTKTLSTLKCIQQTIPGGESENKLTTSTSSEKTTST